MTDVQRVKTYVSYKGTPKGWEALADYLESHGEKRIAQTIRYGLKRQIMRLFPYFDKGYEERRALAVDYPIALRFVDGTPDKIDKVLAEVEQHGEAA